jgi:hypothetical protein
MSDKTSDKTFIPEDNNVTLANGETVEVIQLNWGKEIKVCQLVSRFFGDNSITKAFTALEGDGETDSMEAISNLVVPLINEAPQVITQILAILIVKDEEYINESLTSEDVMQIFIPFLQNLFTKYTKMFQKVKLK